MAGGSNGEVVRDASRGHCRLAVLLFALRAHGATTDFVYDRGARVESARLFGNVNRYAYYFTDLLVGSPRPQRTSVIIDTGSRLVGFPCSECEHCGSHLDPAYDTSQSRSLMWQNCSTNCPDTCGENQQRCPYQETYAEGSEISGFWFEDLVELGDSSSKNPPVLVMLGCHTNENKLFYTQRANGIMGLAPTTGVMNHPSFLESLFQDTQHVNTQVFSICLATWGGRLNVGGYNTSYHIEGESGGSLQWVNMHASHYYYVVPTGVSLGGLSPVEVVSGSTSFGYTIVDSGTTFTYFPQAVYSPLADALFGYCEQHGCDAQAVDAQCWQLDSPNGIDSFPPIRFDFQGSYINWWPESYLHNRADTIWCLGFQESQAAQTVLGISFMLHKDFVFDLAQGRLGVADAECPEYREQPEIAQKFSVGPAAPRLGAGMRFQGASFAEAAGSRLADPRQPLVSWLAAAGAVAASATASLAILRTRWLRRFAAIPMTDEEIQLVYMPTDA